MSSLGFPSVGAKDLVLPTRREPHSSRETSALSFQGASIQPLHFLFRLTSSACFWAPGASSPFSPLFSLPMFWLLICFSCTFSTFKQTHTSHQQVLCYKAFDNDLDASTICKEQVICTYNPTITYTSSKLPDSSLVD